MNWQLNIQGSARRPNGLTGASTSWSYVVRKISDSLKSPSSCGTSQEDDRTPESSKLYRFELLFFVFVLSLISVKKTESVFSWTVGAGRATSSIMNCVVILLLTSSCLTWSSAMYTPSRAGRVMRDFTLNMRVFSSSHRVKINVKICHHKKVVFLGTGPQITLEKPNFILWFYWNVITFYGENIFCFFPPRSFGCWMDSFSCC